MKTRGLKTLFSLQLIGQTVPFLKTGAIFRIRAAVREFTHMAFRIPGTDTETSFSSFIAIHLFTFFLFRHSWRRSTQGTEFMVWRGEPGNTFHIPAIRTIRAVTITYFFTFLTIKFRGNAGNISFLTTHKRYYASWRLLSRTIR